MIDNAATTDYQGGLTRILTPLHGFHHTKYHPITRCHPQTGSGWQTPLFVWPTPLKASEQRQTYAVSTVVWSAKLC